MHKIDQNFKSSFKIKIRFDAKKNILTSHL